jgi:hypothetical protein
MAHLATLVSCACARARLSITMDYFDSGDHVRRGFLSTPDASLCLCSSSMSSNLQHVPGSAHPVYALKENIVLYPFVRRVVIGA